MNPIYRRGAQGPEVARLQQRLAALGFYNGPADSDFGGGTDAAVRAFQKSQTLPRNGIVNQPLWAALFPGEMIAPPSLWKEPLWMQCLAMTGRMETNLPLPECFTGLSGDFDGQGISFGALQWNLGQKSLQSLLSEMNREHGTVLTAVFGPNAAPLRAMLGESHAAQLTWARSIQDLRKRIHEPWRGQFKSLGRTPEYQSIQKSAAKAIFDAAAAQAAVYGLRSGRGRALLFDIAVQNGGIARETRRKILADIARLTAREAAHKMEVARMRIIANRRADAASAKWREDVRKRKLMIAEGEGTVHGTPFRLEEQYGIKL